MTKEKYETIIDAMEYKDIKDDKNEVIKTIPVYKEDLPEDIKNYLFHNIQMELANGDNIPFEQSFKIMYDALAMFQDIEFKDLKKFEPLEVEESISSIYYDEQLKYLNTGNMHTIADMIKEYELDNVAEACAMWYDSTVKDWALTIKDYILNN